MFLRRRRRVLESFESPSPLLSQVLWCLVKESFSLIVRHSLVFGGRVPLVPLVVLVCVLYHYPYPYCPLLLFIVPYCPFIVHYRPLLPLLSIITLYCPFIVHYCPELEYLKSLSRLIMSPHQSCMRPLFPEYVLPIPIKRRRFKIPNVSNKSNQYHSIHQHHHHDATPALDSRLYDRGRSYNKGQSYDRGWNCILLRLVLYSPKTCSAFIPSIHLTY